MGKTSEIWQGDPIEVRFADEAVEAWRPATVAEVDSEKVVAVFDDGSRYTVNRLHKPNRIRPRVI